MYNVIRGGYNSKHPEGFVMSRPNGLYCYLFLVVKSPSHVKIGETYFKVMTNSAIIISPNIPYQYASIEGEYRNDWLYFENTDSLFEEKYSDIINQPISLENSLQYTQYFQNIVWESNYAMEKYRQQNVSMLLQIVMNKLKQERMSEKEACYSPYASKLQEIRLDMKSRLNDKFTPKQLADRLNVSTSYFQALYKTFFGIPLRTDLINMRLEYARELIVETNLTLNQIAMMCGYTNEVHFYRQFRAKMGMTPKEYRVLNCSTSCSILQSDAIIGERV